MNLFLSAIFLTLTFCLTQGSFVGQWTDDGSGGYGLSTYVCVSGNKFFGFYSEFGVMRGTVEGNTATGKWYDPGSGNYMNDETTPTTGSFTLTLADDDQSWSGTYSYEGSTETFSWEADRIDSTVPTNSQCWLTSQTGDSLEGEWELGATFWYVCDADNGSDRYYGSYSYTNPDNGMVVGTGFSQGIYQDGLYRGEWTQAGVQAGVEIIGFFDNSKLRSSWWQGQAYLNASEFVDNSFSHAVDDYSFVDDEVTDLQCVSYFSVDGASTLSLSFLAFVVSLVNFFN
jgi:hypothetical protein